MVHMTSLFQWSSVVLCLTRIPVFFTSSISTSRKTKAQVGFFFHSFLSYLNTSLSISSLLTLSSFDFPWFKCSSSPSSNCYFIFLEAFQFKVIVVCKSGHINYLPYACIIFWLHFSVINIEHEGRTRACLLPPDGNCASLRFLCLVCE